MFSRYSDHMDEERREASRIDHVRRITNEMVFRRHPDKDQLDWRLRKGALSRKTRGPIKRYRHDSFDNVV